MKLNPNKHIQNILQRNTQYPYEARILGVNITITNNQVYPSKGLAEFFLTYLLENLQIQGAKIIDIGAGCSTLGIILAQNGALSVLSTDINPESIKCSNLNIEKYGLQNIMQIIEVDGCMSLMADHKNEFDIVLSGAPWSSMSNNIFNTLDSKEKGLYRAFFDIEDDLIASILIDGFKLLKSEAQYMYISSSKYALERQDLLFLQHNVNYEIVAVATHGENPHYVLRLSQPENISDICYHTEEYFFQNTCYMS